MARGGDVRTRVSSVVVGDVMRLVTSRVLWLSNVLLPNDWSYRTIQVHVIDSKKISYSNV